MNGDQWLDEQETMEIGVKTGFKQGFQAGYEKGKSSQKAVLDKIRAEIERKAHSGQWSDAAMYGMLKAVAIIDKYKESEDKE